MASRSLGSIPIHAMAALCSAPVLAVARRAAPRPARTAPEAAPALTRRSLVASVPALLAASAANPALAKAPPGYYDDTMEVIALTRSIISDEDLSEANIANFQEKLTSGTQTTSSTTRRASGTATPTFNAQAKVDPAPSLPRRASRSTRSTPCTTRITSSRSSPRGRRAWTNSRMPVSSEPRVGDRPPVVERRGASLRGTESVPESIRSLARADEGGEGRTRRTRRVARAIIA